MSKSLYLVMSVSHSVNLACDPPIPMKLNWADGMVGAVAVFSNKAKAKKYANGAEIVEIKEKSEDE